MDGTEKSQDSSAVTQDSSGTEQGTSAEIFYTREQVEKMVSDRLAAVGREAKALRDKEKQVADELRQIADARLEFQRQKEEAELETARDDPTELSRIKREQKLRQQQQAAERKEAELVDREAKAADREKEADEKLAKVAAVTIASKYEGVVPEDLLNFTDGSPDKMEVLAQKLSGKKGTAPRMKIDSGVTAGGGKGLTVEAIRKMSPEELIRNAKEIAKMPLTI